MKEFMFLYRGGDPNWAKAPKEVREAAMARWGSWMAQLSEKGQLVTGGSPLRYDGQVLTKDGVITDVSAIEMKELVSGYSIVKAKDYAEATELAKSCPIFGVDGARVEIRAVEAM